MEKLNEAVYLINDERYLHLRENSAGVGFATYNKVTGEPLESGQISEKNLPPDGRNMMAAARNWYLFVLSEDERKVIQLESIKILESVPASGIHKRRIWEPETMPKDIRLINSHYDDLYRIPDGGVIQSCEDGWDYTLYHSDFSVMAGGQLDEPELTIQEVREEILEAHHMEKGRRVLKDYGLITDKAAEAEELGLSNRPSTLEKLAELAGAREKCDASECNPTGCRKARNAHEL